jgi:hypothetical protein
MAIAPLEQSTVLSEYKRKLDRPLVREQSTFGVRVGLMAIVKAIVVIILGLRVVILHHVTRVSVASCRHCYTPGDR